MKKYLKLRKHTFKTSTSFSSPWRTSHCSTDASSFPVNSSMALRKYVCQMPGGRPGVRKCPAPGPRKNCTCPTPGTDNVSKCPTVARGGEGHCWNWLMHNFSVQFSVYVVCLSVYEIDVSFSCVCPVIDHEFRHKIVKVAVNPRGDSRMDPQTTMLWRNSLSKTGQTYENRGQFVFHDKRLSYCPLSLVDVSHKL